MSEKHAGVTAETLASISTPDRVETSLGTLEFDDGAPSEATASASNPKLHTGDLGGKATTAEVTRAVCEELTGSASKRLAA